MRSKQNKHTTKKVSEINQLEQYILKAIEAYQPETLKLITPRSVITYIAHQVDTVEGIKEVLINYFTPFSVCPLSQRIRVKKLREKFLEKSLYFLVKEPVCRNKTTMVKNLLHLIINAPAIFWIKHRNTEPLHLLIKKHSFNYPHNIRKKKK